jgi:PPOX class probable F420-dependent enzyme
VVGDGRRRVSDPYEITHGRIPSDYVDVLRKRSFGHLATVNPDGTVHNTPVWTDYDGQRAVLLNTLRGRRKERNLRRRPEATVSVTDPENPYRYLSVRGEVVLTETGADEHIDALAAQYLDADVYPHHDEESAPRVIVRIPADRVVTRGRSQDR